MPNPSLSPPTFDNLRNPRYDSTIVISIKFKLHFTDDRKEVCT